jgi:L-cysteine S-thiosulfotransferase
MTRRARRMDRSCGRGRHWTSRVHASMLALALAAMVAESPHAGEVFPSPADAPVVVADGIPDPLSATAGDAARGRALVMAHDSANCVLCHAVPDPAVRFAGDVGPSLAGIGSRMSAPQLRLRVADYRRVLPDAVMPSYYSVAGFERVALPYRGKPILTALEVEDIVTYLSTLK